MATPLLFALWPPLAVNTESRHTLITLEALFIKEIDPKINTKDEYRQKNIKNQGVDSRLLIVLYYVLC